jgi:hypothetical protein
MDGVVKLTKKTIVYQSRTCEEGRLRIDRDPTTHLWILRKDEFDAHLEATLADPHLTTTADRARALSERSGRSYAACRMALGRRKEGRSGR